MISKALAAVLTSVAHWRLCVGVVGWAVGRLLRRGPVLEKLVVQWGWGGAGTHAAETDSAIHVLTEECSGRWQQGRAGT